MISYVIANTRNRPIEMNHYPLKITEMNDFKWIMIEQ